MSEDGIEFKLAEVIANIERRTDSELIATIKETLTAVGTGQSINSVNEQYKTVFATLDKRLKEQGLPHTNEFDDLWEFHKYWTKNGLDTWASRRAFVRKMYKNPTESPVQAVDEWSKLHPVIVAVAKTRFDSKHYADAVEASYKEINSRIKEEVRQRTGKTFDGASLMNNAFSPDKPVIILEDLESEDGRNIQQGYMMMFAGAMIAIRNPKAHANDSIEPDEAIPLIQLASHLYSKFDTAARRNKSSEENSSSKLKGVFVRLLDPDDHEKLLKLRETAARHPGKKSMILVLGKGRKSSIRLPFTVASSDIHIKELKELLGEKNVVVR